MKAEKDENWVSVRVEKGLAHEMDKLIASPASKRFGSRKYTSRSDLVKVAIIKLLEEETRAITKNNRVIAAEVKSQR